jgi:hypothetical protein
VKKWKCSYCGAWVHTGYLYHDHADNVLLEPTLMHITPERAFARIKRVVRMTDDPVVEWDE